jgi:hypothetical protein
MVKVIFKLQQFNNHVLLSVLMVLLPKMEFVKFVISHVLLVLELLLTVFHALKIKFFIMEDAGLNVLQF